MRSSQYARARNKSCAAKAVARGAWKHTFAILHYRGGTDIIINIRGRLGRDFRSAWAFLD